MHDPIAIVLAAGKGTRMKMDCPKVLCQALQRPLVDYVIDALNRAGIHRILLVVGYQSERVQEALAKRSGLEFVEQTEQLGTGHAVQVCQGKFVGHDGAVLVVAGDSPMIQADSIGRLLDEYRNHRPACILGTLDKENPTGLGRIVRDADGKFVGIVEEKDASDSQRRIREVNMSTYVFDGPELLNALSLLRNDNRQQEYYLTDCPGILCGQGKDVRALPVLQPCEALSVNTMEELLLVETHMQEMGY